MKTNRTEILLFQCFMRDNVSVKGLKEKISQCSCDPILRKKSYDSICLENNVVLDNLELLQSYFLLSKKNQFAVAVSTGRTSTQSLKLALPIIHEAKSQAIKKRELFTLSSKGKKFDMLSKRLHAAQCDSPSGNTTEDMKESTEICLPDFANMIFALVFIYIMHGLSNKDKCSC